MYLIRTVVAAQEELCVECVRVFNTLMRCMSCVLLCVRCDEVVGIGMMKRRRSL
jgi:hypothetical protein